MPLPLAADPTLLFESVSYVCLLISLKVSIQVLLMFILLLLYEIQKDKREIAALHFMFP